MALQLGIPEMIRLFTDIAFADPLSLVLVAMGGLLVGASSLLVGYLTLRGLGAWVKPPVGRGPPRQAQ